MRKWLKGLGFFGFGVIVGAITLWFAVARHAETLLWQGSALVKLAEDVHVHRPTPQRLVERIRSRTGSPVTYDEKSLDAIVLKPQTGALGLGGRWIVTPTFAQDGRVERIGLELQPVGWP